MAPLPAGSLDEAQTTPVPEKMIILKQLHQQHYRNSHGAYHSLDQARLILVMPPGWSVEQ